MERAILVGIAEPLDDLRALAAAAAAQVVGEVIQHRDSPDPALFILKGNAEEIHEDVVVRKRPHDVVDAFRATLEEVAEADLILHVIDLAEPNLEDRFSLVRVCAGSRNAHKLRSFRKNYGIFQQSRH